MAILIITRNPLFLAAVPIKQQRDEDDLPSDEDDGLPDTLSGEELTNKRYMGGHIPSRSFKYLQMSVGDSGEQNGNLLLSFWSNLLICLIVLSDVLCLLMTYNYK